MDYPTYIAPWLLREDGSINLPIVARNIVFQSSLNLLVVLGTNRTVTVVDTHSGLTLHTFNLSGATELPQCAYLPQYDRLLMSDGQHICCRTPYNGVLLLDTMLQPPVNQPDDLITIDLLFAEACQLLRALNAIAAVDMKPLGLEDAADMHSQLKAHVKQYDRQSQPEQVKLTKWRTMRMRFPVAYFKTVSAGIMANLRKLDINEPGMAIASAIYERATDLLVGGRMLEAVIAGNPTHRSLMHSEAVRRRTFTRWPHMDYQWALPNEMAQAGFYHQPTSNGDDRAMCFTCNVCLVCWEKTDEPWSEHDRHSPTCPFVRGKCTANVPLVVTHAVEVATVMPRDPGAAGYDIVSTGSDTAIVCTADSASNAVMMWNVKRNLRFCGQFEVYDEAGDVARAFAGGGGGEVGGSATDAASAGKNTTAAADSIAGQQQPQQQRPVRLHAICAYRSWDPATQGGSGSLKGLRLACGVTAGDKQFVFVYRVGRTAVDKWCKAREAPQTEAEATAATETDSSSVPKMPLFAGYEEFEVPLTTAGPEHKLYEQAGKSYAEIDKLYAAEHAKILAANDYEQCVEEQEGAGAPFDEGWTGLPANYDGPTPLDLDADSHSDYDAAMDSGPAGPGALSEADGGGQPTGAATSNNDPKASYNSTNEFCELQGDVYAEYMGCVPLKPEILGNFAIVDMQLSYDDKFVLVVLCNEKKFTGKKRPTKTRKLKQPVAVIKLPTIRDDDAEAMEVDSDNDMYDSDSGSDDAPDADVNIDDEPFMPPTQPNLDKFLWEYDLDVDFATDPELEKPLSRAYNTQCTQMLVYQFCADGTVWPEPIARRIVHRGFTPVQFSAIPSLQQQQREAASDEVAVTLNTRHIWAVPVRDKHDADLDRRTGGDLVCGGWSMVTADGSLQLVALLTLRTVAERFNKVHHFASVVYCRNLERLVAGTTSGQLHFYTCFEMDCDSDADSTDLQTAAVDSSADTAAAAGQRGGNKRRALPPGHSGRQETFPKAAMNMAALAMYMSVNPAKFGLFGSASSDSTAGSQPALRGANDPALLANRTARPGGGAQLSVEDLRRLHALTVFDEQPVAYSAEVPAEWSEQTGGLAQKPHRRHPLSKGSGYGGLIGAGLSGGIGNRVNIAAEPPAMCVKSWKLHSDSKPYTPDAPPNRSIHEEYLLDIALQKSTPLGHIDVRFTTFNPTLTPRAVQVTLLRKNAAFGFRHRFGMGGLAAKKPAGAAGSAGAEPMDWSTAYENNVLKEEYLTANKMDIISGPHDLSHYMNFNELGGLLSLTSPRLFKTKSRHFVLHIKIINDGRLERMANTAFLPSIRYVSIDEMAAKSKRKGILRYLFPSVAKSKTKSSSSATASSSTSSATTSSYSSATSSTSSSSASSPKVSQVGVQTGDSSSKDQGTNTTSDKSASAATTTSTSATTSAALPLLGYDCINDLHVSVRGVKATPVALKLPNERYQRIAMLESNTFLADLMRLASVPANAQQKHLALDILLWVLTIRMKRFRSPRMVKAAEDAAVRRAAMNEAQPQQAAPAPAAFGDGAGVFVAPAPPASAAAAAAVPVVVDLGADMLKQQQACVEVVQKHLVELLRNCILFGNRSTASKCVKALLNVSDGLQQMPSSKCTGLRTEFDMALKHAILVCIASLSAATSASALRWFNVLLVGTSTQQSLADIGTSCVKVLLRIADELSNRWSPYTAVLRSRFGLYGLPFEADLFDSELTVGLAAGNAAIPAPVRSAGAAGVISGSGAGNGPGLHQSHYDAAVQDLKRMCAGDDSASAYVYSMQIRRKCVTNQLRGLLEVEPLHFTCCAASEATRMEPMEAGASAQATSGFGSLPTYTSGTMGSINLASVGGGGGGSQSAATTTIIPQPPAASSTAVVATAAAASKNATASGYTTLGNAELYLPKKSHTKHNHLLEQLMVIENTELMFDEEDMPELQVVESSPLMVASAVAGGGGIGGSGQSPKIDNLDAAIDFAMNSAAGGGGMSVGGPDGQVQYFQPTADGDVLNNVKNMLADKLFAASMMPGESATYKIIMKPASSMLVSKPKIGGGSAAAGSGAASSGAGSAAAKSAEELLKKIAMNAAKEKMSEDAWNAMQGDNVLFTSYHDPETGQFVDGPGAGLAGSAVAAANGMITSVISTGLSPPLHGDLESANINAMMSKRISDFVNENLAGGDEGSSVLPWHKLLTLPAKQMIVIDRMHSGARKFVVLDFGQPVMLTDVIIPACEDLVSLSIDMWCVDELADNTRLLHATDVAAKAVVLSDLQPPPVCRYVKISTASRYGISSARCKIPIGQFFGHVLVMDQDGYADPIMKYIRGKNKNLSGQLRALSGLYEDVHCRYSLASHKLTQLLEPYVQGDHSNIAHMQSYLHELNEIGGVAGLGGLPPSFGATPPTQSTAPLHATSDADRARISLVYEECILYQQQLNIVQNVMRRLQGSKRSAYVPAFGATSGAATDASKSAAPKASAAIPAEPSATIQMPTFRAASSDKLRVYSECILDVLLHYVTEYRTLAVNTMYVHFDRDTCERLFAALVVAGELHQQQSVCALLVQMCAGQEWWGAFMAASIVRLFSAQNTEIFSPDRVFHLLSYLGRKSMSATVNRTPTVIDEVLKALAVQLVPLSAPAQRGESSEDGAAAGPLTADHQLISWLMLYLSVCLDESTAAANIVPGSTVGWQLPSKDAPRARSDSSSSAAAAAAASGSGSGTGSARWEFMSGDADLQRQRQSSASTGRTESARSLSRSVKKRLLLQGKTPFSAAALSTLLKDAGLSKSTLALEVEAHLKQQEHALKKHNMKVTVSVSGGTDKTKTKKVTRVPKWSVAGHGLAGSGGSSAETLVGVEVAAGAAASARTAAAAEDAPPAASGPDLLFEISVRSAKVGNAVLVIRGLIGLLLSLDYMCNMDLFLLTCKIIARLVAACRPYVRFAQLINQPQLQQLVRLCVWKDQQQAWTVHAITSLLQDILEADKQYNAVNMAAASVSTLETDALGASAAAAVAATATAAAADDEMRGAVAMDEEEDGGEATTAAAAAAADNVVRNLMVANEKLVECQQMLNDHLQSSGLGASGSSGSNDPGMYFSLLNTTSNLGYHSPMSEAVKSYDGAPQHLPSLMECDDIELDDMFDDILAQHSKFSDLGDEPPVSAGSAGLMATAAAAAAAGIGVGGPGQTSSGGGGGANASGSASTSAATRTPGASKHRSMGSRMRCAAFVYRTISSAMDYRLQHGLNTTVEVSLRRLTLMSSMNLFLTFPANPMLLPPMPRIKGGKSGPRATARRPSQMPAAWPEAVRRSWPDELYPLATSATATQTSSTVDMLTAIFEEIFAALPITFSWLDVEQVLQLWQTLNAELSDGSAAAAAATAATDKGGCDQQAQARVRVDRAARMARRHTAHMLLLGDTPRIPFGPGAIDGLLQFLCSQPVTGLRTWYLSFQCLIVACNPRVGQLSLADDGSVAVAMQRQARYIVERPAFEQMLVCFYSTAENATASTAKETRNAGPSICLLLRELYAWMALKPDLTDMGRVQRKLYDIKLRVLLQLVQPNGAIATHRGPVDAQLALIESIGGFPKGSEDVGVAMSIVESVSILLQYRNAQTEKVTCVPTSADSQLSSSGSLGSIFNTILFPGQRPAIDEPINQLMVHLVKLCGRLTKSAAADDRQRVGRCSSLWSTSTDSAPDAPMRPCDETNESLTDENKQQQQQQQLLQQQQQQLHHEPMDLGGPASPAGAAPSVADTVLAHQPTMTRLLMALSHCRDTTYAMLVISEYTDAAYRRSNAATVAAQAAATTAAAATAGCAAEASASFQSWTDMQRIQLAQRNSPPPAAADMTLPDAVFELLIRLARMASQPSLIVQPLYEFLRSTSSQQHAMPRVQLSEPFLWFVLAAFDSAEAVACFVQLGGIECLCQALVRSTHTQINRQPGLVTVVMQHLNRSGASQSRAPIITLSAASGASSAAQAAAAVAAHANSSNCPQHGSLAAGSFLAANGGAGAVITGGGNSSQLAKKYGNSIVNSIASMANWGSGIINFAPYCTISAGNPTAQSPDVLIQPPVASHRRARNAAWTHLFYAHETHIDLHLQLPTAVLLREIILQPHLPALVTGPSAVAIEINRDGNPMPAVPLGQPISTIGMSCIRLQLNRSEIASSLVLRLYRPRDSSSIGMTQITVLGTSVFTRPVPLRADQPLTALPPWAQLSTVRPDCLTESDYVNSSNNATGASTEDAAVQASLDWMRILARCFTATAADDASASAAQLADRVHRSAANYPGFLEACCSLLNVNASGPRLAVSVRHLEAVLLKLGLHNRELGLRLIRQLLRRSQSQTFGHLNPAVCDLLYTLCTTPNEACGARIGAMLAWLQQFAGGGGGAEPLANPSTGFVRSLSAILWYSASAGQPSELPALIADHQFDTAIRWAAELRDRAPLKQAIDELLCSMCNIRPELFVRLLLHIGVLEPMGAAASGEPAAQQQRTQQADAGLTDDTKRAGNWHQLYAVPDVMRLSVSRAQLQTIAMACQSAVALYQLMEFGVPHLFASVLQDFFRRMQPQPAQPAGPSRAPAGADRNRPSTSAAAAAASSYQFAATTDAELPPMSGIAQCADLLEFFTRCCDDGTVRDWLGSAFGSCFWTPMLQLLCNSPAQQRYHGRQQHSSLSRLEAAAVHFLSAVTAFHPRNQQRLTAILVDVLAKGRATAQQTQQTQPAAPPKTKTRGTPLTRQSSVQSGCSGASASSTGASSASTESSGQRSSASSEPKHLSGFTRRLVLQLLLESERIVVGVQCRPDSIQSGGGGTAIRPVMCPTPGSLHPAKRALGAQLLAVSAHTRAAEIVQQCSLGWPDDGSSYCGRWHLWNGPQQPEENAEAAATAAAAAAGGARRRARTAAATGGGSQQPSPAGFGGPDWTVDYDDEASLFAQFPEEPKFSSMMAAGVTAKDKRQKDERNSRAAEATRRAYSAQPYADNPNRRQIHTWLRLSMPQCPDHVYITHDTTVAQMLAYIASSAGDAAASGASSGHPLATPFMQLDLKSVPPPADAQQPGQPNPAPMPAKPAAIYCDSLPALPTPLQIFSARGGLALLAHYLPTSYADTPKTLLPPAVSGAAAARPPHYPGAAAAAALGADWVKVEAGIEDLYDDVDDLLPDAMQSGGAAAAVAAKLKAAPLSVPQHSLAAFALFLRLPAYSDVLLLDRLKAQCMLRLVLGVTGDGEGNEIYGLPLASTLPTLPFEVFRQLLLQSPLSTDDGVQLRRLCIDMGAMHLVLNCLGIFTHHTQQFLRLPDDAEATTAAAGGGAQPPSGDSAAQPATATGGGGNGGIQSDDKGHMYWAKGTGFGTGSTTKSWDVEQALQRQRNEEEHVVIFLQVLSSYINPDVYDWSFDRDADADAADAMETATPPPPAAAAGGGQLPGTFEALLKQSCLLPALCSYLRNDSVLDITRHIPLYRAILQLLRAVAVSGQLVGLLLPSEDMPMAAGGGGADARSATAAPSIAALLANMKSCVDTYASRLKLNKKSNIKGQTRKLTVTLDDGDDEGLAYLVPDIQETCNLVQSRTRVLIDKRGLADTDEQRAAAVAASLQRASLRTLEQRYIDVMKALQFDTAEMLIESDGGYCFAVSHYFEANVRAAGDRCLPTRVKRLAQESVTLSTSLPLSFSSTVFVRSDNDRLDIMKVLITGPAETPYANGCFVFDVYFPSDYPQSPMMINLETTGRRTIRFNPNLYNDGKVCLSVLNTWHGRPEERWNGQTSSFLQVLVSIQSLILVPEPYFNEPGFERSRGTSNGTQCSREYNSNIYVANIRWAMCDQMRNTCPIFKDIVHTHFWLKRHEICMQVQQWIDELVAAAEDERACRGLKQNLNELIGQYQALRVELARLPVPAGFEDLDVPLVVTQTRTRETAAAAAGGGASLGAIRARRATLTEAFATIKQTTTQIAAAAMAASKGKSSAAAGASAAAAASASSASGAAGSSSSGPATESLQVLTKQMQKQFQIEKKKQIDALYASIGLPEPTQTAAEATQAQTEKADQDEKAAAAEFEANYNEICESLFQTMDSSEMDNNSED